MILRLRLSASLRMTAQGTAFPPCACLTVQTAALSRGRPLLRPNSLTAGESLCVRSCPASSGRGDFDCRFHGAVPRTAGSRAVSPGASFGRAHHRFLSKRKWGVRTPRRSRDLCSGGKHSFQMTARLCLLLAYIYSKRLLSPLRPAPASPPTSPVREA